MGKELAKELPIIGGTTNEIVLYQPDDKMTLEVKLNNETVWLSLNQMTCLFGRDKSVISRHIRAIFQEGELSREGSVAKNATVASIKDLGKKWFAFNRMEWSTSELLNKI